MATAISSMTPAASAPPMENFAALFEESLTRQEMRQGELITAEVVRVDFNIVVVNAGLKSESFIPIEEFKNDKGEIEVKAGDFVTVAIESLEDGYGETKLSRDKAKRLKAWHDLEAAMEQGTIVSGLVTGKVKGGLTVMVNGIRAFLPGSLVDIRPVKDTTPFENKALEFKVIPDLQAAAAFITFRLEEMERENIFRLKTLKKKGESKDAAALVAAARALVATAPPKA